MRLVSPALLASLLVLSAAISHAAPLSLTISSTSQITYHGQISIAGNDYHSNDSATLSGTLAADISHASAGVPNGLDFTGASIVPVDLNTLFNLGSFGSTGFDINDLQIDVATSLAGLSVSAGSFDLADHQVGLVDAYLTSTSGLLATVLAAIVDFPENVDSHYFLPTASFAGSGTIAESPTGNPGEYLVTVTIPLSATDTVTLADDPIVVDYSYTIGGQIVATGLFVVPEPGTFLLAGLAGISLVLMRRRLCRST
jgi:hypothetical protein